MGLGFWLLIGASVVLALSGLAHALRRARRRRLFLPLARRMEAEYRDLVTTRAPLVALDASANWQPLLPQPLLPDPSPAWAASGPGAETHAAARQFERDCAQLADDLSAWLAGVADAIAQARPEAGVHPRAAADYLYRRLNGLPPAQAGVDAGPPARLLAGKNVLAEGEPAALDAFSGYLDRLHRELLTPYLHYRERFTRLQVALDRLLYHLRALGNPPPPFGTKHRRQVA